MRRILVQPDQLEALAAQADGAAQQLRDWERKLGQALGRLDWEGSQRAQMESRAAAAGSGAATLAEQAEAMGRFLRLKANAFRQADLAGAQGINQMRAPFGQLLQGARTSAQLGRWQARLAGDHEAVEANRRQEEALGRLGAQVGPAPADPVAAMLAQVFPRPEEQAILRHTMQEEGPGKFGAAWGAVLYRPPHSGQLICDRQWLNFGLISFAMPGGTAGGVLRRLFDNPDELWAFQEIAAQHLQDHPGGTVPAGWQHLLDNRTATAISPLSGAEMAERFVSIVQDGQETAARDWLFKYLNDPTERSGIATGTLRADWAAVFDQFLSRPESQVAQLEMAKNAYLTQAVESANAFGLSSVRGVGFMFDLHVQHGSPPPPLLALQAQKTYQALPEAEKLIALRNAFGADSTAWHRRDAVIRSELLTDEPYPGLSLPKRK